MADAHGLNMKAAEQEREKPLTKIHGSVAVKDQSTTHGKDGVKRGETVSRKRRGKAAQEKIEEEHDLGELTPTEEKTSTTEKDCEKVTGKRKRVAKKA